MLIKDVLGISNKTVESRERPAESGRSEGAATASGAAAQAASQDRVNISGRSRDMAKAAEVLSSTPEIREKKVEELRQSIADGSYQVDADKVAQKMIVDALNEIV